MIELYLEDYLEANFFFLFFRMFEEKDYFELGVEIRVMVGR